MTSSASPSLDLSRLPVPLAVVPPAFETILAERISDLQARWPGFDALLESDPAMKLQESDAYREMLAMARINDAVRSVMLAFALGADLDHLAAFYGVERLTVTLATGNAPAVMESDAEFRRRVLLAPEAFAAAGPHAAWVFHALSADPRVLNVDIWSGEPGRVSVAVQSRDDDGLAGEDLLDAVRAHLNRSDIRPLTDVVNVMSVTNIPYTIAVEGFVLPGPAPELIRAEMVAALEAMAATRRTPSRDVPRSAVFAAAAIGPVDKVLVSEPPADIARGHGEVGLCTSIDATVTSYDG